MFETIVVPLDGSALAEGALATIGTGIGARCDARARARGHAVGRPRVPPDLAADAAGAALSTAEEELRSAAAHVTSIAALAVKTRALVADSAAETIIRLARPSAGSMVAMTTRSHGLRRLVVGSVADKIIRGGPRFVLLLQPGHQ